MLDLSSGAVILSTWHFVKMSFRRTLYGIYAHTLRSPYYPIFVGLSAFGIAFFLNKTKTRRQAMNLRQLELPYRVKRTSSEKRFIRFASVEYDGQIYMTPLDFLESLLEIEPRRRHKRKLLSPGQLDTLLEKTPTADADYEEREGTADLFRRLQQNGIISYMEYLFLLSILTKPPARIKIAFSLFDRNGNGQMEEFEYLELERLFGRAWKLKRNLLEPAPECLGDSLEKCKADQQYVEDPDGLQRQHHVRTSIMVHFFGAKGDKILSLEAFEKFMLDLQREMLEMEFSQCSHGLATITEADFAKIILRYTHLDDDDYGEYIDRLLEKLDEADAARGITFEDFLDFIHFLNYLTDFDIVMRMYESLNRAISRGEFQRAVKICTGRYLSNQLTDTIFAIFDNDGDGLLTCREFMFVMKERLHRGFRRRSVSNDWQAFRICLRREMERPTSSPAVRRAAT